MLSLPLVNEAVRLTFEEMAFMDVVPGTSVPEAAPGEEGPVLYLVYNRPKTGAFALYLPKAIKFLVAEAIYGESWPSLSSSQLDDSLLELMNVLAGRLMTQNFPQEAYAMGLPTVLYDPPEPLAGEAKTIFPYHQDDHNFLLVWTEVAP